jgi:hypothetical protein
VVADFDGGAIASDAGALLLGAADRAIRLTERFAACFTDRRSPDHIEHDVRTLLLQRVAGIALRYEDLIDNDQLRHDAVLAVLAGKLAARRAGCTPLAGKSTLNRLELSRPDATRYHRISHDPDAIEALFVDLFLDAHRKPPAQITLNLDATDDPLHGHQGRTVLPRLLRLLLLSAALRLLRPASAGGQAAAVEHRRSRRCHRGDRADRWSDPPSPAARADFTPRGFRFLSRCPDDLVRG